MSGNREPPWQRMPLSGQGCMVARSDSGADGDGLSVGGLSPTHQQPARYDSRPNLGDRVERRPQVITHDLDLPYDPALSDRLIPRQWLLWKGESVGRTELVVRRLAGRASGGDGAHRFRPTISRNLRRNARTRS